MEIVRSNYNNGQLRCEIPLNQNRQEHGIVKYWYEDGQPECEHHYRHGQFYGMIKGWYEDGRVDYEEYYLHDEEVTHEEYIDFEAKQDTNK